MSNHPINVLEVSENLLSDDVEVALKEAKSCIRREKMHIKGTVKNENHAADWQAWFPSEISGERSRVELFFGLGFGVSLEKFLLNVARYEFVVGELHREAGATA